MYFDASEFETSCVQIIIFQRARKSFINILQIINNFEKHRSCSKTVYNILNSFC